MKKRSISDEISSLRSDLRQSISREEERWEKFRDEISSEVEELTEFVKEGDERRKLLEKLAEAYRYQVSLLRTILKLRLEDKKEPNPYESLTKPLENSLVLDALGESRKRAKTRGDRR
jgi:hypothetical protein